MSTANINKAISKSRLNRRLHAIDLRLWQTLFNLLAEVFKQSHPDKTYVVDSLPVAVCDNIRIRNCKLYPPQKPGKTFRGYVASKRRYFYGLGVHLLISGAGEPVEFSLAAGSEADVKVFKEMDLDLPEGATIHADKGYTDYLYEDLLEEVGVNLLCQRKKHSKRPHSGMNPFFRTVPIVNFSPSGHVAPRILPEADSRGSNVISFRCRPPL